MNAKQNKEKAAAAYKDMLISLITSDNTVYDSLPPSTAEILALAKSASSDDSADLWCQAEKWHIDAITAAKNMASWQEVGRLTMDGLRIICDEIIQDDIDRLEVSIREDERREQMR